MDQTAFMGAMFNAPWRQVNAYSSPSDALGFWSTIYKNIIDYYMPIQHKKIKYDIQTKWMNKDIKDTIHSRDYFKKHKCHNEYKYWRNHVVYLIKLAKVHYYTNAIKNIKNSTLAIWKHYKNVIPQNCDSSSPHTILCENGYLIHETTQIANKLNNLFINISQKYISSKKTIIHAKSIKLISQFVDNKVPLNTLFHIQLITNEFVMHELESMPNSKATGPDVFSVKILKISASAIVAAVTHICNLSLHTSVFPMQSKEAKVIPIYKGGKQESCSNYRPISILPILSKILEKHVFTHLYTFLQDHKLLIDSQFGFRKNKSCDCTNRIDRNNISSHT